MLEAKIKFFDINSCGYFLRGNTNQSFSGIADSLESLNRWASDGREIFNTKTYEADPDNDIDNTYFCNYYRSDANGDCILVLWNETHNDNGKIYGVPRNNMPRPGRMLTTGFDESSAIPGFPSYFWVIPSHELLATVVFEHSRSAKKNLDRYMQGFLENKSPCRVSDNSGRVIGFSPDGLESEISSRYRPIFKTLSRRKIELEEEF